MRFRSGFVCVLVWTVLSLCGCGGDSGAEVPTDVQYRQVNIPDEQMATNEVKENITDVTDFADTQPAETVPQSDRVTITISAAGDVTLGNHQDQDYSRSFIQMYDQQSPDYFLKNVKDVFSRDDLTLVNFEGVLTLAEEKMEKDYNMKGYPEYIEILNEGSVEAVSFGNNHRWDYLKKGCEDTVEAFEKAGIVYAYDKITAVYTVKDIKIGIVSVNALSKSKTIENYLQDGIENLLEVEKCELIIACCHWGIERENFPEEYQTELGRQCIDWGADLVLGTHPHVLQGVELYQGKFIVYSLANFCFGGNRNPADKDSMIFQQTFTFTDKVKQEDISAKIIPCSVSSATDKNDFCPTPATGEEFERILERINNYSEPFSLIFQKDGTYQFQEEKTYQPQNEGEE